uniref:Uncharacterized protein n=1 Tax=Rhizophora mucronata TaxID=61149 RepID=A0A2P2N5P4_RHIMU
MMLTRKNLMFCLTWDVKQVLSWHLI